MTWGRSKSGLWLPRVRAAARRFHQRQDGFALIHKQHGCDDPGCGCAPAACGDCAVLAPICQYCGGDYYYGPCPTSSCDPNCLMLAVSGFTGDDAVANGTFLLSATVACAWTFTAANSYYYEVTRIACDSWHILIKDDAAATIFEQDAAAEDCATGGSVTASGVTTEVTVCPVPSCPAERPSTVTITGGPITILKGSNLEDANPGCTGQGRCWNAFSCPTEGNPFEPITVAEWVACENPTPDAWDGVLTETGSCIWSPSYVTLPISWGDNLLGDVPVNIKILGGSCGYYRIVFNVFVWPCDGQHSCACASSMVVDYVKPYGDVLGVYHAQCADTLPQTLVVS